MESELSTPKTRRESEVWQACDDIWAQSATSRQLTGDNIRDQLIKLGYKRGSPNEIYRYRASWKESRGISDPAEGGEAEVKTADPISRAVSLVYEQMRTQTSESIDKLTEEYESRLSEAVSHEESLKETINRLQAEGKELERELNAARQRNMHLDQSVADLEQAQGLLGERLKAASDATAAAKAEQERLVLELKTFHERETDLWREQAKLAKAEAERNGATFSEELQKLKTELRQSQDEKAMLKGKLAAYEIRESADAARAEAIMNVLEQQKREANLWQRKIERRLNQQKSPRRGRWPKV